MSSPFRGYYPANGLTADAARVIAKRQLVRRASRAIPSPARPARPHPARLAQFESQPPSTPPASAAAVRSRSSDSTPGAYHGPNLADRSPAFSRNCAVPAAGSVARFAWYGRARSPDTARIAATEHERRFAAAARLRSRPGIRRRGPVVGNRAVSKDVKGPRHRRSQPPALSVARFARRERRRVKRLSTWAVNLEHRISQMRPRRQTWRRSHRRQRACPRRSPRPSARVSPDSGRAADRGRTHWEGTPTMQYVTSLKRITAESRSLFDTLRRVLRKPNSQGHLRSCLCYA